MIIYTGAFRDQAFLDRMHAAARRAGRRILVPAGATAGRDAGEVTGIEADFKTFGKRQNTDGFAV